MTSQSDYEVIIIDNLDQLSEYSNQWDNLSIATDIQVPTSTYAWISTYFEFNLMPGETWACILAIKDKLLKGVLPLVVKSKSKAGISYQILQLPHNLHIMGVTPLLAQGEEKQIFEKLVTTAWEIGDNPLLLEVIDSPENSTLQMYLDNYLHLIVGERNGRYVDVNGSQQFYQDSLSKNFRSNQRKAENKLHRIGSVDIELLFKDSAKSEYIEEFLAVESSGWKGRNGTAIQKSKNLVLFYTELTRRLESAGILEWHFLRIDKKIIAVNMAIKANKSLLLWKLGYDEEYSKCSPGGLLFQKLIDRAFDDECIDEINLLTNAEWYDNWKMKTRKYYTIRIYNKTLLQSIILGYLPDKYYLSLKRNSFFRKLKSLLIKR